MDIGSRVRAARKKADLSQDALARRTGMSVTGIARIEQGGITDPHYSTLSKIAEGLEVPIGALLEEEPVAPLGEARQKESLSQARELDLGWALSAPEEEFARGIEASEAGVKDLVDLERALIARFRELSELHPFEEGKKWTMPDEFFVIWRRANDVQRQIIAKRKSLEEDSLITPERNSLDELNRKVREVVDLHAQTPA